MQFKEIKIKSSFLIKTLSKAASNFFSPKKSDVNFYSDDKCISCGLCSKVCTANNITLRNGKPI